MDAALREDYLNTLTVFGLGLPRDTKMTTEALDKRCGQAIDASQKFADIIQSTPLDLSKTPRWDAAKAKKPLMQYMMLGNMGEAIQNYMRQQSGSDGPSSAFEDTFREVRQVLAHLAHQWSQGRKIFCLQDTEQMSAMIIRIVDVLKIKEEVPLFSILAKVVVKDDHRSLRDHLDDYIEPGPVAALTTTPMERSVLWKFIQKNAKRVASNYKPRRLSREKAFTPSFLLPIGPLSMQDIGKLTNNPGCAVCGKSVTSRCTQCMSIAYCGRECQTQDWKSHKATCKSLKGGKWSTIPFTTNIPGMHRFVFNRFDPITLDGEHNKIEGPDSAPPPNIHGDKTFLIKMQIGLNSGIDEDDEDDEDDARIGGHIFIYDRQKSFQGYMLKANDRALFREAHRAVRITGVGGLKMYRWARRISDNELSICLDRPPAQNPNW
ncbi:hypothetical protein PLICRDRAFT_31577 [Plicaturopsis crispa FD-325 SS-3]|nr:hypothetical protein PLICRDRAFT_31577 [Plicaturopsis crispa FD-325 SS-3]